MTLKSQSTAAAPFIRYCTARSPLADERLANEPAAIRVRAQVFLEEMADFASEHPPGTLAWARHFRTSRPKLRLDRYVLTIEVDVRTRTLCLVDVMTSERGAPQEAVELPLWRSARR